MIRDNSASTIEVMMDIDVGVDIQENMRGPSTRPIYDLVRSLAEHCIARGIVRSYMDILTFAIAGQ